MACVNRALPEFKILAAQFGEDIAEGLTIQNNYNIPTVEEATAMIKGNKIKQFKQTSQHVQSTVNPNPESFLDGFKRIVNKIGNNYFVAKGAKLGTKLMPGARRQILNRNLDFIRGINEKYGNVLKVSDSSKGLDGILEKLEPFEKRSLDRNWANTVEFARAIFPKEYADQYKHLWELGAKLELSVDVNHMNVPYGATASYQGNTIHLSPFRISKMSGMDELVETFNHELIHGLLHKNSFGAGNSKNYNIQKSIAPLFQKAMSKFDEANTEVKQILAYITDTSKSYPEEVDFSDYDYDTESFKSSTPSYEEFITYALTNADFAKFLESIPSEEKVETSDSVWTKLKNAIRAFIQSLGSPSILDELNQILDAHFDIDFTLNDLAERREKYGWNRPVKYQKDFSAYPLSENKSAATQEFFSDVVTGKSDKFKPKKPWSTILPLDPIQNAFKKIFDRFKGNFDEHIATSIPTFRETQIKVGSAIVNMLSEGGLVYDIGGSEGGFAKAITEASEGKIRSINLDPNPDMQAVHEASPVEGSTFVREAFLESFEDNGTTYQAHQPTEKADVVHESMVFQFISPERSQFIKEIKDKYVKPNGIVLLEEKVLPASEQQWLANEKKKDAYKLQSYDQEAISQKADQVLVGMKKNQTAEKDLIKSLKDNFAYVKEYWDAGNFKGYIATDSMETIEQFFYNLDGKITSEYSSTPVEKNTNSVDSLYDTLISTNGGSMNIRTGEINPSTGYMVAIEGFEKVIPVPGSREEFQKAFDEYKSSIPKEYENEYIGLWINDDQLYFDISENLSNREDAIAEGQRRKQLGIYDNVTQSVIDTSMIPEDNSDQTTYQVDVNQDALNMLTEKNKVAQGQAGTDEEIGEEEATDEKLKEVKKNYSLNHIVDFLSSKFNIPFEFINDPNQKFSGKFSKGKIILNNAYITGDTAFHEIAHPVVELMKQSNRALYDNLVNQISNTKEGQAELARVKEQYSDSTPEEQMDEAIVSLIGKYAEQSFNNTLEEKNKGLFSKILDFVKRFLAELGIIAPDFQATMSIADVADLIVDPLYKYDFQKNQRKVALAEEYEQRAGSPENTRKFDSLIDNILTKLKIDSKTPGKTDDEKTRKYFSKIIAENIERDRSDLQALNKFTDAALFNMLALNKKFDTFKAAYSSKKTKTKKDITQLSALLNEIEDHLALYNDTASLIAVIKAEFPNADDQEFIKDEFGYSLERERALTESYKDWSAEVIADFLAPYMQKSINKALNGGNVYQVVPEEVYNKEANRLGLQGITDKKIILNAAARQYIKNELLIADKDSQFISSMFAGVLSSKDSIAQLIGLAVTDELTKALQLGQRVFHKLNVLSKGKFGNKIFSTNADFKAAYEPYLRKSKIWTYVGMNPDGSKKYEYREHDAFHEEYFWDTFYNKKREDFDALGPRPPKTDTVAYTKWNAARDLWFKNNTVTIKDSTGKDVRIPNNSYKNLDFERLNTNDPFFKEMYRVYKEANDRLGSNGLKYGVVPQKKVKTLKSIIKKPSAKSSLEAIRDFIGEQEQVYYAQKIDGTQGYTVKAFFTHLLDPGDELDYNLLSSLSKFAGASYKFEAMNQIEPQAKILKNFIGGSNVLNMKKRQAYKKTSSGLSAFMKGEHIVMPVEAERINKQLNSYINDAFYGETMETEVKKLWGAQFRVWKTGDTSNNGQPTITTIDGFENLMKYTNSPNLDYAGFEWMKDRVVGPYTIRMNQKDWNFSVKKLSNRLGLLTALNTLIVNPTAAAVNILRGKFETYVEATGGKFFTLKDAAYADAEYFKALGSGDFFEDLNGGKTSFLGAMSLKYDAIQGELIDINGKQIEPGIANRLFRRDNLFFLMNAGEHLIQVPLMIANMNHQKVTLKNGKSISLYDARKQEHAGTLKWSDVNWTEDQDREFRETLKYVNKSLNGNYDKVDKAMFQRKWYGSMFLMYKKHIYNLLANRYRSGYINLESGQWTEGYYRTFMTGVVNQLKEWSLNKKFTKPSFGPEQKYAFRKIMGDLAIVGLLISAFKLFDDDDDKDELTDEMALISRRLISESGQYTPMLIGSEMARIVKNPFAATNTIDAYTKAIEQTISDPHEVFERSGSGYKEGQNKAAIYWGRAIPGFKVIKNVQEPERLLDFYRANSADFIKPSSGDKDEE